MRKNIQNNTSMKPELNLLNHSFESLKNTNNSHKKTIFKSTIETNNTNKNKNKLILNSQNLNSPASTNKPKNKLNLYNNSRKNSENIKNESMNESENSEPKLKRAKTKVHDNKLKLNKFFLSEINTRNNQDKNLTLKLINRSILKPKKEPYKVFKTNLNDSINNNMNVFLYQDEEEIGNSWYHLKIPEEDKIFNEFKKYDYFTERYNKKYKIKDTIKDNDIKEVKNSKSVKFSNKITAQNKEENRFIKTYFDSKGKFMPSLLDKEIFDCLYKTSDEYYSNLDLLKKSKRRKKLKDYQNELLYTAKNVISIYGYDKLKRNFEEIEKWNKFKKVLNFRFIKQVETDEKKIIKDVIKQYKNFYKSKKFGGKVRFQFKFPKIQFRSVIKNKYKDKKWIEFMKNRNNTSNKMSRVSSSKSIKSKISKKDSRLNTEKI